MKCLLFLSLVAVAAADDFIIASCLFENWDESTTDVSANMNKVGKCIKCYEQIGEPMDAAGLEVAKACTAEHLPWENEACSESIAATDVANEETLGAVEECFEEWLYTTAGNRCLGRSTGSSPVDIITDSIGCLMETHKNVTMFEKAIKNLGGPKGNGGRKIRKIQQRRRKGGKGGKGREMKKYIMGQLLPKAYCNVANDKDVTRQEECNQCFANLGEDWKQGSKDCAEKYLSSEYQDCQDALKKLTDWKSKEAKAVMKCYAKRTLRYVVEECNPTAGDLENLFTTYECGKQFIIQWVGDNAEAKYAEKIIEHLEDDDDDDEDDE